MGFDLIIGNKTVTENQEEEDLSQMDTTNWNTCKHRSQQEEEYFVETCCGGSVKGKSIICHRLGIKNLRASICAKCSLFEPIENTAKE